MIDIEKISGFKGDTAMYFEDLTTGETRCVNADKPLMAASVIKLFIMAEAFRAIEAGEMSRDEEFVITPEKKMPSCGALTYMHSGLTVTAIDLITLMIILSDNTATNMLIDKLGIDSVNATIRALGCEGCVLNRRLFDSQASKRGVQNYITARGVGKFMTDLYNGRAISETASKEMLDILLKQRLNAKIPFFLDCPVAHKTGEDDGITHDAGIVLSEKPFTLVMLSNNVNTPEFIRVIQDTARAFAEN